MILQLLEDCTSGRYLYLDERSLVSVKRRNATCVSRSQESLKCIAFVIKLLHIWFLIFNCQLITPYGLDVPGIESRWGRDFPHLSRPALRPTHTASYTLGTGSFPGVKRPGRGVYHPPPSSAVVKERVELYLYSPSGPSWPVLVFTFTFTFLIELF